MLVDCERSKIELALDLNKNQNSSFLGDIVTGALSMRTKLSSSSNYFNLLTIMVTSNEVRHSMIKHGLVEKIVKGLKEIFIKKKDDYRMEYCIQFLAHLSFFEECHELLLEPDTIDHLVEQVEKTPNDTIKEHLILTFRNLLFCKGNSTLILRIEELCVLLLRLSIQLKKNLKLRHYTANFLWTYLQLYIDSKRVLKKGALFELLRNVQSNQTLYSESTLEIYKKIFSSLEQV